MVPRVRTGAWVPMGGCRMRWVLPLVPWLLVVFSGCRATPRECRWPAERLTSASTLLDDLRLAEDLAIRFADGQGYRAGWRVTRESCEAALFGQLAAMRNIRPEDISAARAQLNHRGFDWVVNLPMAGVSLLSAFLFTRGLRRRFDGQALPIMIATAAGSLALAVAVVAIGQVWAAGIEAVRLGNGHLSYRAYRIPWSGHRIETFVLAMITVWVMDLWQLFARRRARRTGTGYLGTNP